MYNGKQEHLHHLLTDCSKTIETCKKCKRDAPRELRDSHDCVDGYLDVLAFSKPETIKRVIREVHTQQKDASMQIVSDF
jgi:hypothetical protein